MMRLGMMALAGALACAGAGEAMAEATPAAGRADARVRYVAYDGSNVVRVETRMGVSTMLDLGEGEKVETLAAGDTLSWSIVPTKRGDVIFVKPLKAGAATNLSVVTAGKKAFIFELREGRATVYAVKFRYPEEERARALVGAAKDMASHPNIRRADARGHYRNYVARGSEAYRPTEAFDDGIKTFLRFAGDVPAFFLVQPDGTETLLNWRREGEYIVVDKVASQLTLRKGSESTCVYRVPEEAANAD